MNKKTTAIIVDDDETIVTVFSEYLELFDIRSPDSKAFVWIDGKAIEIPKEDVMTYQGYVNGDKNSKASFLISARNEIVGFISTDDNEIAIESLSLLNPKSNFDKQIMYSLADLETSINTNDIDEQNQFNVESKTVHTTQSVLEDNLLLPIVSATTSHWAQLIFDCDVSYYNLGTSNWQTRQLTVALAMNQAYLVTNSQFSVVNQFCNNNQLSANTMSQSWDNLHIYWKNLSNPRNMVIGMIGKDVANADLGDSRYIGGLSDKVDKAYSVIQMVPEANGGFSPYYQATALEQKILASHEAGHQFGATHTNTLINGHYTIMKGGVEIIQNNFVDTFTSGSITEINNGANTYLP